MTKSQKSLKLAVAGAAVVGAGLALLPAGAQALLTSHPASAAASGLSDEQLVAMYEEERLAGDVYDQLALDTGAVIFTNIGAAEDRHASAVATLLAARDIDVAELPSTPGVYTTNGYTDLYTEFVADGQASLADAYQVGVDIETADIADLEDLLGQTSDPAEVRVLTVLLNGSQHHLAAFSGEPSTDGSGQTAMNQYRMRYGNDDAGSRAGGAGTGMMAGRSGGHQYGLGQQSGQGPGQGDCDGTGPSGTGPRGYGR